MFCALVLFFGGAESSWSLFHVLRSRTHFRQDRVRSVPFSCFALPHSFSAVPRALGLVFVFCTPRLVFVVCNPRTQFRLYRWRQDPLSHFALPDTFSAFRMASGPDFMFCAPGLIFGATEVVGSRIHILRSRPCFPWYRGCRVPFSCFARRDSFSTIPRASGLVFMFCVPGLIFGGNEGVGS
jgi:hypothetical protein